MKIIETIELKELGFGGEGIGYFGPRIVHLWDAFPGEIVKPIIFKKRRGHLWGRSESRIQSIDERNPVSELHFLSCSPWSGITFEKEQEYKAELFKKLFGLTLPTGMLSGLRVVAPQDKLGYRNKMEYSFALDAGGSISLAFIERMGRRRIPIDSCVLARPEITRYAVEVITILNELSIPEAELKSLIVRSDRQGSARGALFVKTENLIWKNVSDRLPDLIIYYSNPKSPMSRADKLLYGAEDASVSDYLLNKKLNYGLLGFFQVNIPIFEEVLTIMRDYVADENVVDMFCGVGAISIVLADSIKSAVLVDNDQQNIKFAQKNIIDIGLSKSYLAECVPAEKALEHIVSDKVLILDPNRPGLHKDIIARIRDVMPKRIIYLSCNPETQARDLTDIIDLYSPIHCSVYNFFPRTPHIESLIILEKK